ncbi:primosomal protein N' [Corynebacterium lowii]|uniref:Probable replication restart protein PriA n=1 Tax=Corynebacterium lowii TaxID=1544413 RepID=A0A0Q0Z8A3_9CORY|nr:primosomal protein N' [Corynebacterium lowii]KQB85829.1 Primosomal protein N' [Corynebacterium lowii]MDP9851131.1 primosomal protein N' (replication factor Y) [Corynebacterium lowii]
MATSSRVPAAQQPVARVLPLLGLAHLDRLFDYQVSEDQSEQAQPGVRVRIRFAGRLVDAMLIERSEETQHPGQLRYIERVISPEVVYPESTRRLVDSLCARYAGTRSDLIRSAIPARHAGAEQSDTNTPWEELGRAQEPDLSAWSAYEHGESFVDAVLERRRARVAWQIAPGDDWAAALAALAAKVALGGGGVLIVAPDQADVDTLEAALKEHMGPKQITVLGASLGPQGRYRRFLSILHGQGRVVIGTRSAAFAPVENLELAVVLFDGDENHVDPRAPYAHTREVLTTRVASEESSLIIAGHARTAEAQLLVESGWAHSLTASRETLRVRMPRIQASADSDFELSRDPRAGSARIPAVAFRALREGLEAGRPVLVHTPRKGYIPTLACGKCRNPARCRHCNGPVGLPTGGLSTGAPTGHVQEASVPTCRWCGRPDTHHRCTHCGSPSLRAVVLGNQRTAEELGRAFASVRVISSGGNQLHREVPDAPALVVATPGAEPRVAGGGRYGAAVLLDTWALLGRQDLRATEETLAKWAAVATLVEPHRRGGQVVVVADPGLAVVQHLIRWDMPGAAARELEQRREVRFPPAVHMAAIDGAAAGVDSLLKEARLPEHADILGPVDLPAGEHIPGEYDEERFGPAQRVLVRTPLGPRGELGAALKAAMVARIARREDLPLRVRVDPVHIG